MIIILLILVLLAVLWPSSLKRAFKGAASMVALLFIAVLVIAAVNSSPKAPAGAPMSAFVEFPVRDIDADCRSADIGGLPEPQQRDCVGYAKQKYMLSKQLWGAASLQSKTFCYHFVSDGTKNGTDTNAAAIYPILESCLRNDAERGR